MCQHFDHGFLAYRTLRKDPVWGILLRQSLQIHTRGFRKMYASYLQLLNSQKQQCLVRGECFLLTLSWGLWNIVANAPSSKWETQDLKVSLSDINARVFSTGSRAVVARRPESKPRAIFAEDKRVPRNPLSAGIISDFSLGFPVIHIKALESKSSSAPW